MEKTMSPPDDDVEMLAALPIVDLDARAAKRLRRRAEAVLADESRHDRSAIGSELRWTWSSLLVPALLGSTAIVYLGWAIQAAAAVYR
jgi:hypothetical protein